MTTPAIVQAAEYIREQLASVPKLTDVQFVELPSDGRTFYGGWVMPKCWNVREATLKVCDPAMTLADYRQNPFSLMMWSPPTGAVKGSPEAIEAPVVATDAFKNGERLRGKFALIGNLTQAVVPVMEWLVDCGAVGLISDTVITTKGIKEGEYLDDAIQYWNYSNPQWDRRDPAPGDANADRRLPAFGLTPRLGRELRAILQRNSDARLSAFVDSDLSDGVMPLVTARLPGVSRQEFVLTAHMDEPGASDNASGVALAMELLRCLAAESEKTGRPPNYTIRFIASVEARGLQAYLNTGQFKAAVIGGLNLDMVGYDHTAGRTHLDVFAALPSAPSLLEHLATTACELEASRDPLFKFKTRRTVVTDDCHFAGLPFNAPMCCLEQAPDKTYHSSLDVPENLSGPHLTRMCKLVFETMRVYGHAKHADFESVAEALYARALDEIQRDGARAMTIAAEARGRLLELAKMIPDGAGIPDREQVAEMRRKNELIDGYLYPKHAFEEKISAWVAALNERAKAAQSAGAVASKKPDATEPPNESDAAEAKVLIPLKLFSGYLAFEDLNSTEREELKERTGLEVGWGAASWLQWALDLSNGRRSLLEIYDTVAANRGLKLRVLVETMKFLERRGQLRFRPYLTKKDVLAALRSVGVSPGDIVMTHSSVSDFGYIEGGADGIIDCLLEAVGVNGTVCVPTHSLNWVGKPPYDPKTAPSFTGAVPKRFLRRPQAQRSLHPTHSVAAIGPHAAALLKGHDHRVAPQGREGFWGNLVDAGGKIVMLCKLGSNTLLHGGELWAGVPYPPCECHFMQDGKRVEVTVPGMPWHVHAFDLTHDDLRSRLLLYSARLGESTIYSMDAREAVETMMRIIKKDPTVAIREKCDCDYCNYLRKHLNVTV